MHGKYETQEPSLTPPEPIVIGHCSYCGEEIYAGNRCYKGDEGMIHLECILPAIQEAMSESDIASACGYREVVA